MLSPTFRGSQAGGDFVDSNRLGANYRRLLLSAGSSNLGDGIRIAAMPLLAVTMTDQPLLISGVTAATFLPAVLFGPIGGVLVDRKPRRTLIVIGQLVRAFVLAAFMLALLGHVANIWAVYLLALVLGMGEVIVDGAAQAAVPSLAPDHLLERANARMISAQTLLDELVGRALGGLLFAVTPILPFFVDGITFLIGGMAASTIATPLVPDAEKTEVEQVTQFAESSSSYWHDLRTGIRFLWGHKLLRRTALTVGLNNLGTATGTSVLVILIVDELSASEATFGLVLSAGAAGGFAGSVLAERLRRRVGRAALLIGSVIVMGLGLLTVALSSVVIAVGVGVFAHGLGVATHNIFGRSLRQEVTPDNLLGRVVTTYRLFGYVGVPVGAGIGGLVTDQANAQTAFVVAAAIVALASIVMLSIVSHLPDSRAEISRAEIAE